MKKERITSLSNPTVKAVAALKEKKYREKAGLFVVEGKKMVTEALQKGLNVTAIYTTEKCENLFPEHLTQFVSEEVFRKMSDEVSPEGVLATLALPTVTPRKASNTCIFLDGVRDPGNLGTILRTAAAVGVKEIYLADTVDPFSPKVIRSSMSGIYVVNVYRGSREELLPFVSHLPVIVADMGGENVFKATLPASYCLVIGNEANGVSQLMKNAATHTVSLPMQSGVESLNAAVSLSVLLYVLENRKI